MKIYGDKNMLKKPGISDEPMGHAASMIDFYEDLQPEEIVEISFADFFQRDGNSQYENLWFFTRC
jgi:hypothetical protein